VIVELTWREVRLAACAAIDLRLRHMAQGGQPERWGRSLDGTWQREIEGALGEIVVAKAFDRYWLAAESYARATGDVARLQVRSTSREGGGLIVHPDDADDAVFILVIVGRPPRFRVPGWLPGDEAKLDRWWRDDIPVPAFLIPQNELRPIDELLDERAA
jgi:hypothetical protein